MQELLALNGVHKRFGTFTALNHITWNISRGECVAIIGGNGAGKSTLLHIIAGLASPSGGLRIERINALRIGYVPERFPALRFRPSEFLHHMASIQGMDKEEANQRIDAMMSVFQLRDTTMTLCSKGMLQKVNLMQALLRQPDLLILDEPLSGLDEPSQMEMIGMMSEIKRQGTAIVMSVHEPLLMASLADRVTQLTNGQIERDGLMQRSHEEARMRLEFTSIHPDRMQELELSPGFLFWISRGNPASMVVRKSFSDEMVMVILQFGGSMIWLGPWNGETFGESEDTLRKGFEGRGA